MALIHELATFKTLAKFKDTANDTALTTLQERVYNRIEAYLGRFLEKQERTEEIRIVGPMIPLKALPVDREEDITVEAVADFSSGESVETFVAGQYEVTNYGLKLNRDLTRNEKLRVTYTGGYAKTSGEVLIFPDDDPAKILVDAALEQLQHEWNKHLKPGAETITTDLGTIKQQPLELLKDVKEMCNPVRHPRMWWFG